jgi:hypothetical protein
LSLGSVRSDAQGVVEFRVLDHDAGWMRALWWSNGCEDRSESRKKLKGYQINR